MMINRVENQKVIVILMSCIGLLAKKWPIGYPERLSIRRTRVSSLVWWNSEGKFICQFNEEILIK